MPGVILKISAGSESQVDLRGHYLELNPADRLSMLVPSQLAIVEEGVSLKNTDISFSVRDIWEDLGFFFLR